MASCCFFIHKNVKEFKPKNIFDEILSLSFDLNPLKMNTYCVKKSQFCKGLSKGFI
jgi:hypothetical protein